MNASVTPIGAAPSAARAPAPIASVEEIVAELAAGRMVILVDEEDRENEGDIVIAADHITAESINFMARHARGLICLTLSREMCDRLQLPPMVDAQRRQAFDRLHRLDRSGRRRHHRHLGGRPRPHRAGRRGAQRRGRPTWCSPATSSRCRRWTAAC
jgi:hypothetical protein